MPCASPRTICPVRFARSTSRCSLARENPPRLRRATRRRSTSASPAPGVSSARGTTRAPWTPTSSSRHESPRTSARWRTRGTRQFASPSVTSPERRGPWCRRSPRGSGVSAATTAPRSSSPAPAWTLAPAFNNLRWRVNPRAPGPLNPTATSSGSRTTHMRLKDRRRVGTCPPRPWRRRRGEATGTPRTNSPASWARMSPRPTPSSTPPWNYGAETRRQPPIYSRRGAHPRTRGTLRSIRRSRARCWAGRRMATGRRGSKSF
mmetsp:Transcript_8319/g.37938  ORF Transcript_8319/g.37938 Transcript_8319/m.37938 type:complete len:262 (-) Transcript_8319:715-1500(-)